MIEKRCSMVVLLVLCLAPVFASASTLQVSKESEVSFNAKITGSSFKGECELIQGTANWDAASGSLTQLAFSLQAEDIKTGMGQRDGHMYDNYLETKTYPQVVFQLSQIAIPAVGATLKSEGSFTIHGKTKVLPIVLTVKERTADTVSFQANWVLNITDFGIKQPKFLVVKMRKEIKLEANIVLVGKK